MTRVLWMPILGLAALAMTGCGPAGSGGRAPIGGESGTELAEEQVIHWGNGADPGTLDPQKGRGVPGSNIQRDLFEGLIAEAPNGDLIPGVAETWDVSEDGLTYTFHLREDARWSNGDAVTAEDFVFGLRRAADPATLSEYSFIVAPILNAEAITAGDLPPEELGVRAIDERTLEIGLRGPTPYFLGLLSHPVTYPVHRPSLEEHGVRFTRPGNLIGNGAYTLVEAVVQSHVRLERNPYYWDDESTTIDVVYHHATEDTTAELKRYRADELDATYFIPKAQLPWIRENLPDELTIAPYLGSYYYGFNLTKPPFKGNLALRRALALAIDREIITKQITNAGEIAAFGFVPPVNNYEGQQMPEAAWSQQERETEARRLYLDAGYSPENPLRVELLYNTQDDHRRIAVAVASMWRRVLGVQTEIVNQEWKVYLDTRTQKEDTQVFRAGWIGDYNDAYTFAELPLSDSGLNDFGYDSEEYDALVAKAGMELDMQTRAGYLQEAERVLLDDMPLIPIYFYVTAKMVKPWVDGYEPNIMDHYRSQDVRILKH
ncbi:MAG: peptide ABC transporter substrate-binding protein [Gammaproteobacteria bacterium]|nr:peptide ABC transporter substrate-binding protein [Gammaproteobacteria bacterium]